MSSFAITPGRPSTCAMPSAASITVPTSVAVALPGSYAATKSCERVADLVGADAEVCHRDSFLKQRGTRASARETESQVGEAGADGAVDHVVADRDPHAADQRRVDHLVDHDFTPVGGGEALLERLRLGDLSAALRERSPRR